MPKIDLGARSFRHGHLPRECHQAQQKEETMSNHTGFKLFNLGLLAAVCWLWIWAMVRGTL